MKILGITNDRTVCDKCGKTNLKRTVILETSDGNTVYYGSGCAAHALLGKKSPANNKIVTHQALAVQVTKSWLEKGYSAKDVSNGIWNKFGYQTGVKNGILYISTFATIDIKE